jgi:multiple sugar transport system substrate-binding protein
MTGPEQRLSVSRRRFVGVVIGGAVTTLLAACGGAAQTSAPTSAPTSAAPAPTAAAKPTAAPAGAPTTAAAQPTAAAAAQAAPAVKPKAGASLKILMWSHFVPAYDEWFDKYAKDWGSKNNVTVSVDHITNSTIPARLAAEASAGAGHDLFEFQAVLQASTYKDKLVDLTDVANTVSKKYGGWTETGKTFGVVDGKWLAVMDYAILQPHLYRVDYFKDVGYDKFPDDYPTLLEATAKLKEQGHPCGLPLSNCNDGNHNWRSVLYSFGGTEQSPDGQKVTIASDETLAAIKFGSPGTTRATTASCCPGAAPGSTTPPAPTSPPRPTRRTCTPTPPSACSPMAQLARRPVAATASMATPGPSGSGPTTPTLPRRSSSTGTTSGRSGAR